MSHQLLVLPDDTAKPLIDAIDGAASALNIRMFLFTDPTLIDTVIKAKPAAAKGKYVKSIALSSTMGPGVRVDLASVEGHA